MASDDFQVIVNGSTDSMLQNVAAGPHRLKSDEPIEKGGTGEGPDPYSLLLASLGSCTSITLGMYARMKHIPLERVTVRLRHRKVHAEDCADCDNKSSLLDFIDREIELEGELTPEQRKRLLEIADKCPVHRTLTSQIKIQTTERSADR